MKTLLTHSDSGRTSRCTSTQTHTHQRRPAGVFQKNSTVSCRVFRQRDQQHHLTHFQERLKRWKATTKVLKVLKTCERIPEDERVLGESEEVLMGSAVVLVLLLTCVGVGSVQASPIYVSPAMETHMQALEEPYNLKDPSLVPKPIFLVLLKDINTTLQRHQQILLLNATLSVYVKMLSSMLADPGAQTQHTHLELLRDQVLHLKKHVFQSENPRLHTLLHKLDAVQVEDKLVQRKALNELKEVFQVASEIGSKRSK
ncbi:uncharacterized protein LOC134038018 [Osmerus eperlanus]|uniref:uncharacterized protein LOC134038018 n=1 Tax=Osmerus eperlanus TaxID=29151 RepID=UPI002E10F108